MIDKIKLPEQNNSDLFKNYQELNLVHTKYDDNQLIHAISPMLSNVTNLGPKSQITNYICHCESNCSDDNTKQFDDDSLLDGFASLFEKDFKLESKPGVSNGVDPSSIFLAHVDTDSIHETKSFQKEIQKNSIIITKMLMMMQTHINSKILLCNTFNNGQDVSDRTKYKNRKTKLGKAPRRNGFILTNEKKMRDSFSMPPEFLDIPDLTEDERRDSVLLASTILGYQVDEKECNLSDSMRDSFVKMHRDPLIRESSLAESQQMRSSSPNSRRNLFVSLNKKEERRKRKSHLISDLNEDIHNAIRPLKRAKDSQLKTSAPNILQPAANQEHKYHNFVSSSMMENAHKILLSLVSVMKSSRESQRSIDEWDKKMGLNRSHSRTMVKTMKSRKKLLQVTSTCK